MALVTDLTSDQSSIDLLEKSIKIRDRFGDPRLDRKAIVWRKRNYKELEEFSSVPAAALLWDVQGSDVKTNWETAAAVSNMTGYELFVQVMTFRLLNGYTGIPVPKTQYQYKVLYFGVPVDSNVFSISQYHFDSYQLSIPIVGKKNARQVVDIVEDFISPVLIEFDYFSDLVQNIPSYPFALHVSVYGYKGGVDYSEDATFVLNESADWVHFSEEFTHTLDVVTSYTLTLYGWEYSGFFMLDNVKILYSSQNWAFDPNCDNVTDLGFFPLNPGARYWTSNLISGYTDFGSLYLE